MRLEGLPQSKNIEDRRDDPQAPFYRVASELTPTMLGLTQEQFEKAKIRITGTPRNPLLFWRKDPPVINVTGEHLTRENREKIGLLIALKLDYDAAFGAGADGKTAVVRFHWTMGSSNKPVGEKLLNFGEMQGRGGAIMQGGILPSSPEEKVWRSASVASEKPWKRG